MVDKLTRCNVAVIRRIIERKSMFNKAPKNFRRTRILEENLLEYMDKVDFSERNKDIVRKYVSGTSYKSLADEYQLTTERIASIVRDYILKVSRKLRTFKEGEYGSKD